MIVYVPLLVSVVGAAVYVIAANPKISELGRGGFWTGLLVTLLHFAGETIGR